MAYRHVEIGGLIRAKQFAAASVQLEELFGQHGGMSVVAKALNVHRASLHRWCEVLMKAGWPDPRERALEVEREAGSNRPGHSLCVPKSVVRTRRHDSPSPSRRKRAVVPLPPLK